MTQLGSKEQPVQESGIYKFEILKALYVAFHSQPGEFVNAEQIRKQFGLNRRLLNEIIALLKEKNFVDTKYLDDKALLKITSLGINLVKNFDDSKPTEELDNKVIQTIPSNEIQGAEEYSSFSWDLSGLSHQTIAIVERQEVVEEIEAILEDSGGKRIVFLYGQPLVGKTFVLDKLCETMQESYVPVFIHVNGWASTRNLSAFLEELATSITICFEPSVDFEIEAFHHVPEEQATTEFLKFMNNLSRSIGSGNKPFLLMFDELEYLAREDTDSRIFEYLVGFIQTFYQRIRFIFAGSPDMLELLENGALAKILARGQTVHIACFLEEISRELIGSLTRPYFELESNALDKIIYLTDGHPCLIKEMLHNIYRDWKNKGRKSTINEEDINNMLDEIHNGLYLRLVDIWHRLSVSEQQIVKHIAQNNKTKFQKHEIPVDRMYPLSKSLGRLVHRQVFDQITDGTGYTVRLGILIDAVTSGFIT